MSKWLANFLDDMPGHSTDKPDTLLDSGTVSVMSVPIPSTSAEISGLHPNDGELISSPPYLQQDSDGGHSEDSRERQPETPSEFLGNPLEAHTDITDTVTHMLDETPRITTDKPDTLAEPSTVSVLSVPGSGIPLEISVPALAPGCIAEWLSPALPRQQAKVLAVHEDGTFEAFHPLTEIVCRMPMAWITRVVTASTNPEGPTP